MEDDRFKYRTVWQKDGRLATLNGVRHIYALNFSALQHFITGSLRRLPLGTRHDFLYQMNTESLKFEMAPKYTEQFPGMSTTFIVRVGSVSTYLDHDDSK